MKTCEVSKAAYDRGYGTLDEVVSSDARPQDAWSFDVSRCFDDLKAMKKRRSPRWARVVLVRCPAPQQL